MLGSGIMNFCGCLSCGLRVALGTDSSNSGGRHDLFAIMRLGMMLPRAQGGDFTGWPDAARLFDAATQGGAAALGLKEELGRVAPGQLADLVLVRATGAATLAAKPSLATLVQHAGPEHVDAVMVDGRWVMRANRVLAFDEAAVLREAQAYVCMLRDRVAVPLTHLQATIPELASRFLRVCG
jgi:5-methylthioadenosine/S-adenosylhomocysteine deaminase